VGEVELGRLEITFCFLMDFGLKVGAEMLQQEVLSLNAQRTGRDHLLDDHFLDSPVSLGEKRGSEKEFGELQMSEGVGVMKRKAS
jgi:hypothetical protein